MRREKTSGREATENVLNLWVQPRASRNEIVGYRNEFLRIRVTAAPIAGEANRICQEMLAKALRVPVSQVEIVSGQKARRKRVRIWNADPARIAGIVQGEKPSNER